jgi:alkaline phosphatase D
MTKCLMLGAPSRRALLAGMIGAAGMLAFPGVVLAQAGERSGRFRHGVASGDPAQTSVVLWTRVTGSGAIEVEWELSDSLTFERIVKAGKLVTGPERDHTVKLLAAELEPGGTWYFRFRIGGETSPVGRARTLAKGRLDQLGIALASCSNYAFGFFNAYDAIAADPDIDFVLHTGDYIYEYGAQGWGADVAKQLGRVHEPANEIVSLSDYRQRHAQYKSDAGSRAMHAAHTLISCWDDHESTNNPWTGGAQNHQPKTEGDWAVRRAASVRAYFEWMPVREPEWLENSRSTSQMQFWRSYSFGDLASLVTLETRHTARAKQIDYGEWFARVKTAKDAEKLKREVLGKPGRRMLSSEMEADLADSLARSVSMGQPWRLIGNPMPIAKTDIPDFVGMGILPEPQIVRKPDGSIDAAKTLDAQPGADLAWKGKWNLPFYEDTWDGYPWAREQLYALSRKAGAGDLVFLTGDSHSFWANKLADDAGRPAGIELGTAGISSPGDFIARGFSPAEAARIDRTLGEKIDEIVWTDNLHQGYVRVVLTKDRGKADFIAVSTVLSRDYFTKIVQRAPFVRKDGVVVYEGMV